MLILTMRTDTAQAELGLYEDVAQLIYRSWQAHRLLAETIHLEIQQVLAASEKTLDAITGIVVFPGPGSFTGLRIGLSVANALAASLPAAIVSTTGDDWIKRGIEQLLMGQDQRLIVPEYGAPVHLTTPKK
jgi:tRNA threonylcarbamoyladenosine biosynthesis protein TsaB